MIFNSFAFFVFFLVVFSFYTIPIHRWQNTMLLCASYFFYAAWDYRFCSLLLLTTTIDYLAGIIISKNNRWRKTTLIGSIAANLTILGFFKYFNFFTDSFASFMSLFGFQVSMPTLQIILPVGISFYTFQSMSYTIDLYRREISPVKNFLDYALYVSFFPQLVAGPIERAKHLLPQILRPRHITFTGIQKGTYYLLVGLFLKLFLADNLARLVNPIFTSSSPQTGFTYLLAGYGFTFQIYGDFAGYSYFAKGLGAFLGFDIMNNFNLPYFAKNPQDFWRRWHISLSTWLRDYLYIPLGGNRGSHFRKMRNLLVTMLLGGLWHGAKITFVIWGAVHGILLIMHHSFNRTANKSRTHASKNNQCIELLKILLFFHVVVMTWFIFRAESYPQLISIFKALLWNFQPEWQSEMIFRLSFYIFPVLLFQLIQHNTGNLLFLFKLPVFTRVAAYITIFYMIVIFGVNHAQDFIYFQF